LFLDDIVWFCIEVSRSFRSEKHNKEEDDTEMTLYTIPISKLIEFLFRHRTFNNKNFLKELICDNKKFKQIWDVLEKKEILMRWKNNWRVLNEEMTIEMVVKLLTKDVIHKEKEWVYSYNPI